MRRRENAHGRALLFVCICQPILKYFPLYLILRESKRDTRGYKYEVRRFTHASSFRGGYRASRDEIEGWRRGMNSPSSAHGSANTGFHQDGIQIGNMFTLKTFPSVRPVYIPRCVHRAHWRWRGERVVATLFFLIPTCDIEREVSLQLRCQLDTCVIATCSFPSLEIIQKLSASIFLRFFFFSLESD